VTSGPVTTTEHEGTKREAVLENTERREPVSHPPREKNDLSALAAVAVQPRETERIEPSASNVRGRARLIRDEAFHQLIVGNLDSRSDLLIALDGMSDNKGGDSLESGSAIEIANNLSRSHVKGIDRVFESVAPRRRSPVLTIR